MLSGCQFQREENQKYLPFRRYILECRTTHRRFIGVGPVSNHGCCISLFVLSSFILPKFLLPILPRAPWVQDRPVQQPLISNSVPTYPLRSAAGWPENARQRPGPAYTWAPVSSVEPNYWHEPLKRFLRKVIIEGLVTWQFNDLEPFQFINTGVVYIETRSWELLARSRKWYEGEIFCRPLTLSANAKSFHVNSSPMAWLSSGHSSKDNMTSTYFARSNVLMKVTGMFPSPGMPATLLARSTTNTLGLR